MYDWISQMLISYLQSFLLKEAIELYPNLHFQKANNHDFYTFPEFKYVMPLLYPHHTESFLSDLHSPKGMSTIHCTAQFTQKNHISHLIYFWITFRCKLSKAWLFQNLPDWISLILKTKKCMLTKDCMSYTADKDISESAVHDIKS